MALFPHMEISIILMKKNFQRHAIAYSAAFYDCGGGITVAVELWSWKLFQI